MAKKDIKIWDSTLIHKDKLVKDPKNTNKQSRATFKALQENIKENGFDEPLIVVPNEDGETFTIFSGNHRFPAGLALGMVEFPCIVRDDWDQAKAYMQSVRRNYARGSVDKNAFSALADTLSMEYELSQEEVMEGMGFGDDEESFAALYERMQEAEESASNTTPKPKNTNITAAAKVKLMDDLGLILSHIFENYGESVPFSFVIFPAGDKQHMFVQSTNALKKVLQQIGAACVEKQIDINTALAGILTIGVNQTEFLKAKPDVTARIKAVVEEATDDPEDTNFEKT